MTPAVSVVLATRDPDPGYLGEAVRGVLAQTAGDLELVVVDDGSANPVADLLPDDGRIRVLRQGNAGVSVARNNGVAASCAGLLAFLDDDDRWSPTKLARQLVTLAAAPGAALCDGPFDLIDERGDVLPWRWSGTHHADFLDLLGGCGICLSTVVVPRTTFDAVGGFDPSLGLAEDWDLFLRLARHGPIVRVEGDVGSYRWYPGNSTRDYRNLSRSTFSVLDRWEAEAGHEPGVRATIDAGRRRFRRHYGTLAYDRFREDGLRKDPAALGHLAYATRHAPGNVATSMIRFARKRVRIPAA